MKLTTVNLEDVARRAGVSISTVSRVLNNSAMVKNSTRARVLKVVKELRYHPNLQARTLAGGKSQTLGVIVSNLSNPFFLEIFRAFERDAHQQNYEVLVANTDYSPKRLVSSLHLMMGRRVGGLALIVSEMDPGLMKELEEMNCPIVLYDVGVPARHIYKIRVNYEQGIRKAVEYLYSMGHRRMAFVGHHPGLSPLLDRKKSFLNTMKQYSSEVEFETAADRDGPEGGQSAMRYFLDRGFKPTTVICVNDFMAFGVLKELRESGLRVPEDVSVTGYDNIRLSEFIHPPLTTVNIPRAEIGRRAFQALVPLGDEAPSPMREFRISPELVIRETTGPANSTRRSQTSQCPPGAGSKVPR